MAEKKEGKKNAGNYLVEKQNVVNEMDASGFSLTEHRFFLLYLAYINARDPSTRRVRIFLNEFLEAFGLDPNTRLDDLRPITESLASKVLTVRKESGGWAHYPLFSECSIDFDEPSGRWFFSLGANDRAMPLLFDYKDKYVSFRIANIYSLKSKNQVRMYEILKQYEYIGERIVPLGELRRLLGVEGGKYAKFKDFRIGVLDACQAALAEHTDIKYGYEKVVGAKGKVLAVKFRVYPNEAKQKQLESYISRNRLTPYGKGQSTSALEAASKEFTAEQMEQIHRLLAAIVPDSTEPEIGQARREAYFEFEYSRLNTRSEQNKVHSRFGYLSKVLQNSIAQAARSERKPARTKMENDIELDDEYFEWLENRFLVDIIESIGRKEREKEASPRSSYKYKTKASSITLSDEDMLMTNAQIAKKYGTSESSIKRIKAKAKKGE